MEPVLKKRDRSYPYPPVVPWYLWVSAAVHLSELHSHQWNDDAQLSMAELQFVAQKPFERMSLFDFPVAD